MQKSIKEFLSKTFSFTEDENEKLADGLVKHVTSPEFVALLQAWRNLPDLDLGLGQHVNLKWRIAMSTLTDAMAAAINQLKSETAGGGVTTQQVTATINSVVGPQLAALQTSITNITNSEATDASKIADINAALAEFTTAFAPPDPALPVVTGIVLPTGVTTAAIAGGTLLTINGSGLTGATSVNVGTVAVTAGITVVNDGQVTVPSPAIAAGTYDVTVQTPAGVSVTSAADQVAVA
jgi:hypothetical protein